MPFANRKQGIAIFLDLQRRKGMAAAKAFARKHQQDMKAPYRTRKQRTK